MRFAYLQQPREAVEAAAVLSESGVNCTVAIVSCVNPIPADDLASILAKFATVMTVEAHYITGGVGSLVSEIIAERARKWAEDDAKNE